MTCRKYINHYMNHKDILHDSRLHDITNSRNNEIYGRAVQGVYILDGELSLILGELVNQNSTSFPLLVKVDDNQMYLDEVKLNSFKIKDSNGNLIKDYNFNSFINMQYKVKVLNGKEYGALVISNYGTFNDLKRIEYSTKTYDSILSHQEEFLEYDDAIKTLFTLRKDESIENTIHLGYIITDDELLLIVGKQNEAFNIPNFIIPCGNYNIQNSEYVCSQALYN